MNLGWSVTVHDNTMAESHDLGHELVNSRMAARECVCVCVSR